MFTTTRITIAAALLAASSGLTAQVPFKGLLHEAEGNAQLSISNGFLQVANIGSSGLDGVCIDLGASQSHTVVFDVQGASRGSQMEITTRGTLNGVPDQDIWTITSVNQGSTNGIILDTSIVDAGQLRVEAFLDGEPQGQVVWAPVPIFPPIIIIEIPDEGCWVNPFDPQIPDDIFGDMATGPECWATFRLPNPGPVTLTNGPTVIADEIVLASSQQANSVDALSQTVMRGSGITSFRLADEMLGMFGNPHRAEGNAMILGDAGTLTVQNIGSSGLDGVCIDLDSVPGGFMAELEPIGMGQPGRCVRLDAFGDVAGMRDVNLGTSSLERTGFGLELSADYSALGAAQARIDVFEAGVFSGSVVVPAGGLLGTVLPGPNGPGGIDGCGKRPPEPPCFIWQWDRPVVLAPTFGPVLQGDEFRVLAVGASVANVLNLNGFCIRAKNLPGMTINDEVELEVPKPFTDLGCSLAGTFGPPSLVGIGPMEQGTNNVLDLSGANPSSLAVLFVSLTESAAPFKGGTLKTLPIVLQLNLGTNPAGNIGLPFILPPIVPDGLDLFFQYAIADPGAPQGVAISNGLQARVH